MTDAAASFAELLRPRAARSPEHLALAVDGGDSLTYADWERRADAAGRALAASGVKRGDRVCLLFDNARWTDYAVAYLGTLRAGGAAVPLSPRVAPDDLRRVLAHAEVAAVVAAAGDPPQGLAEALPLLHPADLDRGDAGGPFQVPVAPEDLAEIVYTSGTTGTSKGVATTHGNLLAHDLPAEGTEAADGSPVEAAGGSFAHAFPVGTNAGQECLRMPLRRRTTAYVLPVFDPERLCALVAARRVRRLQLVPAMAQLLVDSGAAARHDVGSVERITLSSSPATPELWGRLAEAFPAASLWNAYALTEGGGARTLARHDPAHPDSVGHPVGATEVRVVDDSGRDVAAAATGEVLLRRRGAPARGYYRDPDATAAAFTDGWLRTGDVGYLDEEGGLHLVDRLKDLVISGGLNISSVEVESALAEHPAVVEAAAFGVPHPVLGQAVAAAVVLRSAVEPRELQALVRGRLGEARVPRRLLVVDALPRTETGKVRKGELRERAAAEVGGDEPEPERPRTPVEDAVAGIWREVLGLEDVGLHDDFFALGGHSLAATQIVARLEVACGAELPVTLVFERPTVAEQAEAVGAAMAGAVPG